MFSAYNIIPRKRVFVDMDWVIADLTSKWLMYYNAIFKDDLSVEDIKDWDLRKFVKDGAKDYALNIFSIPGFYKDLDVIKDSQKGVKWLMDNGFEVYILTDPFVSHSLKDKWEWLEKNFSFIPTNRFIFSGDKSVVGDGYLIDDGLHNLDVFKGQGIVFDAPYNRDNKTYPRVRNWTDVINYFKNVIEKNEEYNKNNQPIAAKEMS